MAVSRAEPARLHEGHIGSFHERQALAADSTARKCVVPFHTEPFALDAHALSAP
jgi:hypothetical protein